MIVEGGVMRLRVDGANMVPTVPSILAQSGDIRLVAKAEVTTEQRVPCVVATVEWAAADDMGGRSWRREKDHELIALKLLDLILAIHGRAVRRGEHAILLEEKP